MNMSIALPAWQIFAILGIALLIAEIFVSGFVLLPIGVAFLLTAAASIFISSWPALVAILAVAQLLVFWVFQNHLKKYLARTRAYTNAEGMIGSECVVTETIRPDQFGQVKLYGDTWQAGTYHPEPLEKGRRVAITRIDGNKVFVEPVN
jgi:membrane protein implicated in regulation of membrane protease activity